MTLFNPRRVYYESGVEEYPLGRELLERYSRIGLEMIEVRDHNKIPELRELPDQEFPKIKHYLVIGVRKSTRILPNNRSADYIVPFTSSGCSAMCLYCYLVCTFFKNSYLRVFVNREEMMRSVQKKALQEKTAKIYEIGSNSDLVLEESITGSLKWAIEEFARIDNAYCTFATKFAKVDSLLNLDHRGHTQIRISVNPPSIIKQVELGTAPLQRRIEAANKLFSAGYRVGINIAPVILLDGWEEMYLDLLEQLRQGLDHDLKKQVFIELILMTYGLANELINQAALPGTHNVFEKEKMRPKGRGKYCYLPEYSSKAADYFRSHIQQKLPGAHISYIV